ncbi:ABC transporter ATP-binding protein [Piscinibacterium candidicorallinum]|uniref:ABC transporter ATP-binding protein n=1 Tax=Piscinibacterium candidicorallinum TaxID=1793872 RepID=A0ABV7H4M9_9BURK
MILRGIDLSIKQGELVAIMGGSGSGKTTLLRLIGGLVKPTTGTVRVFDQDISPLDTAGLYAVRKRMGMLFQFGALFTDLSVAENVAYPLREHTKLTERQIRDLVLLKLHAVGLRGAAELMPSQISGGMARRVALARAVALDPELILYDEPFAGLDPISLGITAQLIRNLNDALGATSIIVSHDVTETFLIADRIVLVADGQIAAHGTPAELRASTDPRVTQFINGEPDGPVKFHMPAPRTLEQDFLGA